MEVDSKKEAANPKRPFEKPELKVLDVKDTATGGLPNVTESVFHTAS